MISASVVDVSKLIDDEPVSHFQVRVVALCFLASLIDGFDVQAIGYVAPVLRQFLHIEPASLAVIFSAGLLGIMAGALLSGMLADIFGRRPVILACLVFFGIATFLTTVTRTATGFAVLRFITGLGLGGIVPNGYALTAEYSPARGRATAMMVMCTGFSLGAAFGGALASRLIPVFGWHSVFYFGAIIPMLIAPILAFALPESIRFLALKRQDNRVAALLSRIGSQKDFSPDTKFVIPEEGQKSFPIQYLFREGRATATLLLWFVSVLCLIDLYFLTNWLPTLAVTSGLGIQRAVLAGSVLQIGGTMGAVALGRLIDKKGYYNILIPAFVLGGLSLGLLGSVGPVVWAIMLSAFVAGFAVIGAQIGLSALAASYYPTFVRSTGVGWSLGIGRFGSIAGTLTTGYLLALHWRNARLFQLAALPALLGALGLYLMKSATAPGHKSAGFASETLRQTTSVPRS